MFFRGKTKQSTTDLSDAKLASAVDYHYRDSHRAAQDYQAWLQLRKQLASELADIQRQNPLPSMSVQPAGLALTQQRLLRVSQALKHNIAVADNLLKPIASSKKIATPTNHPGLQWNFLRYLIRDWGEWGGPEIEQMLDALAPAISCAPQGGLMVAPGAGAMRLPMELAEVCEAQKLIGIEMDPLLCHGTAELLAGKPLTLYEIPIEPIDLDCSSIKHQLSIPPQKLGVAAAELWAGDANECIDEVQPDILFTPFILDVAGGDVLHRSQRWVQRLRRGAWWINIGPISLREPHARDNYSRDELQAAMQQAGLQFEYQQIVQIPHLNSPFNQRHQLYSCWIFAGVKR